jgi:hypothetical protein
LLLLLPNEAVINADETGHKCNCERWWTWCFPSELYTLYHIDAHRSADVLLDILARSSRASWVAITSRPTGAT